ncbi:NAD(P)-binding protein [Imleria badia]|nr:NAD(P)-binding protein [Imleria badia]
MLESASRGIGLKTTRQLLQTPTNTAFATCLSPSTATDLAALASSPGTLHIVKLDVADEASIKAGTDEVLRLLNGAGLDYVLNNAAINRGTDLAFNFNPTNLADSIVTNVTGPALISRYLLPAIEKSNRKVIMNMTSGLASIASDHGTKCTSYSISKAAVNMLVCRHSLVVCLVNDEERIHSDDAFRATSPC